MAAKVFRPTACERARAVFTTPEISALADRGECPRPQRRVDLVLDEPSRLSPIAIITIFCDKVFFSHLPKRGTRKTLALLFLDLGYINAIAGGKTLYVWDSELAGFGVLSTKSGSASYFVEYRIGGRGAPNKRVSIGKHGHKTPEQARKLATIELGKIAAAFARRSSTEVFVIFAFTGSASDGAYKTRIYRHRGEISRNVWI